MSSVSGPSRVSSSYFLIFPPMIYPYKDPSVERVYSMLCSWVWTVERPPNVGQLMAYTGLSKHCVCAALRCLKEAHLVELKHQARHLLVAKLLEVHTHKQLYPVVDIQVTRWGMV